MIKWELTVVEASWSSVRHMMRWELMMRSILDARWMRGVQMMRWYLIRGSIIEKDGSLPECTPSKYMWSQVLIIPNDPVYHIDPLASLSISCPRDLRIEILTSTCSERRVSGCWSRRSWLKAVLNSKRVSGGSGPYSCFVFFCLADSLQLGLALASLFASFVVVMSFADTVPRSERCRRTLRRSGIFCDFCHSLVQCSRRGSWSLSEISSLSKRVPWSRWSSLPRHWHHLRLKSSPSVVVYKWSVSPRVVR
jgi:hypothetical protein